ncbi:MAG TPA: alpha-2-macroglobulin family protein, partial [Labilithrix sp.]
MRHSSRCAVFFLLIAVVLFARHSEALPSDPAARGLDVFLHAPPAAIPGGTVEIAAQAIGFPVVTRGVPLAGATIEAGWDPESLASDGADAAPPPVSQIADAEGRVRIVLPVPRGAPETLKVLVSVRHGAHARTRELAIARAPSANVELHVADTRVVPTSTVSAWVRVIGAAGEPLADAPVTVSLLEGGVARHVSKHRTDRGGLVMARVPIPRIDEPVWEWKLRAETAIGGSTSSEITLAPREETPGTPTLAATWDAPAGGALPGDRVPFAIRLRDATGQPLVDHALRFWIGVKGTTAPEKTEEEWKRASIPAISDGAGEVRGERDAPTLVKAAGTAMILVAHAEVEGHFLRVDTSVAVGAPTASMTLEPELAALVPGATQKMTVVVSDARGDGVAGPFHVTGDGLDQTITTDARGEAEIAWAVPAGVGAMRNVGPCAGGVAAAVVVQPLRDLPALRGQREAFTQCVSIDREAGGFVRVEPNVARPGEKVHITYIRTTRRAAQGVSVVARSHDRAQSAAAWLDGRTLAGELVVPSDAAGGVWTVTLAATDASEKARVHAANLLVVPTIAPVLEAKRVSGRAAPGGTIDVEARLTDGHGRGLPGAVSAIVVDAFGGGYANVASLDTRSRLCGEVGADDRCDEILERDPATDAFRRALFGRGTLATVAPANDPGAHASAELRKAFQEVLRSLEGAVFEAAKNPQTLLDVRRRESGRWVWNPELFGLVTDAMNEPPMTPGGEKLVLADLVAVDPQVTFDVVARRVTRLKLFGVLAAVRDVRARGLDPDEPVFRDPNALVRRLVRAGSLPEDLLLDPWGGTIQFVKANGPPVPFLSIVHGWELHAPGPDGLVGTADDVRDPFERVVRSGTPYANAVQEDKLVDAKWDMVVSEETVRAWQQLFTEVTGTALGDAAGGLGLSGVGEGGGGSGQGIGLGNIGTIGHGAGRAGSAIANGDAFWSPPRRTDAEGRVRLAIPLGDAETTWRVALVGVPDGQGPASTTLDVASDLPLSTRVQAGAKWVEGDVVDVRVVVRNRTNAAVRASIHASADGEAALGDAHTTTLTSTAPSLEQRVDVPAHGARDVRVRVRALRPGEGRLVVVARAEGLPEDVMRHSWEIVPAGERRALTRTRWVDGREDLALALDHGYRLDAAPRLVLERGWDDAIAGAIASLEPDKQTSTIALADSLDAATRIERWATTSDKHRALAASAHDVAQRALGRLHAYLALDEKSGSAHGNWTTRARVIEITKEAHASSAPECPKPDEQALDVEPAPTRDLPPCWGAYVSDRVRALSTDDDPERLAEAILALADRPWRSAITASLVERLRRIVKLRP